MNQTAVVRPLPGAGLAARSGELLLVCADTGSGVDELLDLVAEVAAAGGDGSVLVRRVAAILAADYDGRYPACAVSGPVTDGRLAVLVHGAATADIAGADGTVSLSGVDAITSVNRLINGPVTAVRLQLPMAGAADPRARFDGGVVSAAGVQWANDGVTLPAPSTVERSWEPPAPREAEPAASAPWSAREDGAPSALAAMFGPSSSEEPAPSIGEPPAAAEPAPPYEAPAPADDAPAYEPPAPAYEPPAPAYEPPAPAYEPSNYGQQPYQPAVAGYEQAPYTAPDEAPAPLLPGMPPRPEPVFSALPPLPPPVPVEALPPVSVPPLSGMAPPYQPPYQPAAVSGVPLAPPLSEEPMVDLVPMRQPDPAAPFVAVVLGNTDEAVEGPSGPGPDPRPRVLGVLCPNTHFNDPGARYCALCGITMAQEAPLKHEAPRPPLGFLLVDDGSSFRLDVDYVIGREPQQDPEVVGGTVRPLRVNDAEGIVSRRHARIVLVGWDVQVVDLGSANGTFLAYPGDPQPTQLAPNQPVVIRPGAQVTVGRRWLRFESHRNP